MSSDDPTYSVTRRFIKNDVMHIRERAVQVTAMNQLVGNTPLVRLTRTGKQGGAPIYVKLENLNPSGSIRDRYIAEILQRSSDAGQTMPGDEIALAGLDDSTLSAAFLAATLGLTIHTFLPRGQSTRLLPICERMGVVIHPVDGDMQATREAAVAWSHAHHNRSFIDGFRHIAVRDAYRGIADEILLAMRGKKIGTFITSVSTGSTFREVAPYLRDTHPDLRMAGAVVLDADLDALRQNTKDHLEHVDMARIWSVRDAVARAEGILLGPKGAACVALAMDIQKDCPVDQTIVALNPDAGQRYLGHEDHFCFPTSSQEIAHQ